jgi:hypothetical protein
MRKFIPLVVMCLLLAWPVATVQAAPPPDGPPGLERAIEVKAHHEEAILGVQGVAGIGVGFNGDGRATIIVFTDAPGVRGLPASLEDVPVIVQFSGKFVALPKPENPGKPTKPPKEPPVDPTARFERPVPIGVSTGHIDITAGTIGARVTDGENVYALSNNHVYADENNGDIGDLVLQPGPYDGGLNPGDGIGTLYAFEPIVFSTSASNVIDAAIALSSTSQMGNATPGDGYGTPESTTLTASINMKVKKYGRTTGLTSGRVYAVNATVNVGYDSGVARFVQQIIITPGSFSAGGDSGSLIVADAKGKNHADNNKPVGLLFAGSDFFTVANPIDEVLSRLGVTIDGK